jgi:hypothetical protein
MAEPGDEQAAAAAHHRMRASDDDRERAVARLKAAFVHGRLTKDELAERAGRALSARTYGDLAALTSDLPAERVPARRARRRLPKDKVVGTVLLFSPPPVMVLVALLTRNDAAITAAALTVMFFLMAWLVALLQVISNHHDKRRARGQRPPRGTGSIRPPRPGTDGRPGDDLVLTQAAPRARAIPRLSTRPSPAAS